MISIHWHWLSIIIMQPTNGHLVCYGTVDLIFAYNTLTGRIPSELGLLNRLGECRHWFRHRPKLVHYLISVCISNDFQNNSGSVSRREQLDRNHSIWNWTDAQFGWVLVATGCTLLSFPWTHLFESNWVGCLRFFWVSFHIQTAEQLRLTGNALTGPFTCPYHIDECTISCEDESNDSCRSLWRNRSSLKGTDECSFHSNFDSFTFF